MSDRIRQAMVEAIQDARNGVLEATIRDDCNRDVEAMLLGLEALEELNATGREIFLLAWYLGYVSGTRDSATVSQEEVEALVDEVATNLRSPVRGPRPRRAPRRRGR